MTAFLDRLASEAPAPGGGAAAALSAALGAALVAMVCNLTIGRERYRAVESLMRHTRDEAERLRAAALVLADDDSAAYQAVIGAYALPRGSESEKATRQAEIQQALKGATEVPLRTIALAAEIGALCAAIADSANTHAIGDVGVGALHARTAFDGAALNVAANLALIHDEAYKATTRAQMTALLQAARAQVEAVVRAVEAHIGA